MAHGVDDLQPAAVVDRQAETHAGVGGAQVDRLLHFALHGFGNIAPAADDADADVLLHDRGALFDHVLLEQVHEKLELALRPLPIFARQAVERQLLDIQPGTFLGRAAHAGHAAAVPLNARQTLGWAQRPLPSMMIATCLGRASSGTPRTSAAWVVDG